MRSTRYVSPGEKLALATSRPLLTGRLSNGRDYLPAVVVVERKRERSLEAGHNEVAVAARSAAKRYAAEPEPDGQARKADRAARPPCPRRPGRSSRLEPQRLERAYDLLSLHVLTPR